MNVYFVILYTCILLYSAYFTDFM